MSDANSSTLLRLAIRKIALQTRRLAVDELLGVYSSVFKGKGMEFDEVREYEYGDEPRNIDWNVTARMGKLFVKSFKEEREITILLVVDVSSSCLFGSLGYSKAEIIAEISATLAFSAIFNQDKVGLLLFSDRVEKYIPPRNSQRHVLRIIRELLTFQSAHSKTSVKTALDFLQKTQKRNAICIIISDFLIKPDYEKAAQLAAKRYDTIAIRVADPLEKKFAKMELVQLKDLETDELYLVDSNNKGALENYQKENAEERKKQSFFLKKCGIDLIDIQTDEPYLPKIKKFFRMRLKRR